jgi:PAS domain S-box-containing protein
MRLNDAGLLRDILDSAHNGVLATDREGRIFVFNRAAARVMGLDADRTMGRFMGDLEPETWEDMQRILATGEHQIGRTTPSLTGSTIIANRTPIISDGKIRGVISIFQDASDYENVLDELEAYKELNEELNVIFNSSFDGLWISDSQGRVLRVNPTSKRFLGIEDRDVTGKNVQDLVTEGLFDRSATLEVLRRRTAVSIIQKSRDGMELLVTGNPVYDEKGNIRLVVINARDLTGLKRLQAELEESRALTDKYRSELTSIHDQKDLSSQFISRSVKIKRTFEMALKVARVDSSVLILGESGVGKSLIAQMIHRSSLRRKGPLVRVDCAGMPPSLIEAELFGYVKGAFTGARGEGKPGYFEMAAGGTLLLEEVGELPMNTQGKLLRFLEENEVVRLGDTTPRKIDVRVLAATNRNLQEMVDKGDFRKDLFFRLSVVPILIPPLRQRPEDIPALMYYFLQRNNSKCGTAKTMAPAAVDCLCRYSFPGNVRELANLMEQLVVMSGGEEIEASDLPAAVREEKTIVPSRLHGDGWNLPRAIEALEKEMIAGALAGYGSQRAAARHLGIDHSTLSRKARKHGLSVAE